MDVSHHSRPWLVNQYVKDVSDTHDPVVVCLFVCLFVVGGVVGGGVVVLLQ